jgi:hypothetical protein
MYGRAPYPPFVFQYFSFFARLPFEQAFVLWLAISLCLYVTGVMLALRTFIPDDPLVRSVFLCLAIAYSPFLMSTLANGHLSSVGSPSTSALKSRNRSLGTTKRGPRSLRMTPPTFIVNFRDRILTVFGISVSWILVRLRYLRFARESELHRVIWRICVQLD